MVKKIISILATALLLSTAVYAESLQVQYTRDIPTDSIIVSVKAKAEDIVVIEVMPTTVSPEIIQARADAMAGGIVALSGSSEKITFFHADEIGESGKISYTIKPEEFGDYDIYVTSKNTDKLISSMMPFCSSSDYGMIIGMFIDTADDGMATLPGSTTEITYDQLVSGYGKYLGLEAVAISSPAALERFRTEMAASLSATDYELNKDNFIKCAIIEGLNADTLTNAVEYVEDAFGTDTTLLGYLNKHITNATQAEYFTKKLSASTITDAADLLKKIKEALVLTVAQYPDGNINLKYVMDSYKTELGLTSVSSDINVYSAIAGTDYADVSALLTAYGLAGGNSSSGTTSVGSTVVANNSDKYVNSGGDGFSISGGSAGTSTSANALGIKFEDLDTVVWAYEHIARLYAEGIVNGYTETRFMPNNTVLREQLVKMLVCALNYQDQSVASAGFNDVVSGSWYEPHVDIAKANGIANGMPGNRFGVGLNITRQDMATMIYNAMLKKGYQPTGAVNAFADKDACASYANEAIAELSALGIITGVGGNMFNPTGVATRAQAAVMLSRALQYLR